MPHNISRWRDAAGALASGTSAASIGALVILALAGPVAAARAARLAHGLSGGTAQLDVIIDGRGSVSVSPSPPAENCEGERLPCNRYTYAAGQQVTLTATEDSRFVGWSDERCPVAPTCTLPMDADRQSVAARFENHRLLVSVAGDGTVTADGTTCSEANDVDALDCGEFNLNDRVTLEATPAETNTATNWGDPTLFVARMRRAAVSGHGRHRAIVVRLQLNAPATVRAVLSRGHRRVASGRWRVAAGSPLLRMRVPAPARRGVYRLALTIRDGAGHTAHATRRVRLPR